MFPRRVLPFVFMVTAACTDPTEPGASSESESTGDGDGEPGDGDGDGESGDGDGEAGDGDGDGDGEPGDGDGDGDGDPEPDPRLIVLQTYAPRVWFPSDEEYWPSSVEFAFPYLGRFVHDENNYWLRTIEPLGTPSDTLSFFAGELQTAPTYAFWADKGGGVVDLVYWMYYPYNRGKDVADTIWGNHVGDWEHVTVRLVDDVPTQIYVSAHSFGGAYDWGSGEIELFEGTHPVVYSAWGSHGLWSSPGEHAYMSIGEEVLGVCVTLVCVDLVDDTSAGLAWDTWERVVGFDFFEQVSLDGGEWPVWMSDDFTNPGAGAPTVPGMGPIYRWGNPEDCSVLGIPVDITDLIGVCRLEDGPTGPVSKSTWGAELQ